MNVIAEKNKDGVVDTQSVSFKVPQNHSMLSILGSKFNPIIDGADYRDDYWVYVDGKRVKKWFTEDFRWNIKLLWPPNLQPSRLAHLEALAYRLQQRSNKIWGEFWKLHTEARERGGPQHHWNPDEIIVHVPGTKDDDGEYKAFACTPGGVSRIRHKPVKRLQHPDLGAQMDPVYTYQEQVQSRAGKVFYCFHKVAVSVIVDKCKDHIDEYDDRVSRLTVNGREYVFKLGGRQNGAKVEMISSAKPIIEVAA